MELQKLDGIGQIEAVEDWIKEQPQLPIPTQHVFSDAVKTHYAGGIYEREIFVQAGALITGKIHLSEHLAKLTKGTMRIFDSESGGEFTGPITFISRPGVKRIGFAITDCWFSTFHVVNHTDIEQIERELGVDSIEEYELKKLEVQS